MLKDRQNRIEFDRKRNYLAERKSSEARRNSNATQRLGRENVSVDRSSSTVLCSGDQVVTIEAKPFIFSRPGNDCQAPLEVFCPRKKLNGKTTFGEFHSDESVFFRQFPSIPMATNSRRSAAWATALIYCKNYRRTSVLFTRCIWWRIINMVRMKRYVNKCRSTHQSSLPTVNFDR